MIITPTNYRRKLHTFSDSTGGIVLTLKVTTGPCKGQLDTYVFEKHPRPQSANAAKSEPVKDTRVERRRLKKRQK